MDQRQFKAHTPTPAKPEGTGALKAAKPAPSQAGEKGAKGAEAKEIGGPSGPEPTRYGDWERKGICVDF